VSGIFKPSEQLRHWLRVRQNLWLGAIAVVWILGIAGGFWLITDYELQPAVMRAPPTQWPTESRIHRAETKATLVMFVHPRCPCSRASLAELARIVEREPEGLAAHVLFTTPAGGGKGWTDSALWKIAAQIPGLEMRNDVAGREAALFGADASGQTLVYDRAGRLTFSGGITAGRGHYGANPSSDKVLSLLRTESVTPVAATSVYGCPLCLERDGGEPKR
jgi:hypothetical protein